MESSIERQANLFGLMGLEKCDIKMIGLGWAFPDRVPLLSQ